MSRRVSGGVWWVWWVGEKEGLGCGRGRGGVGGGRGL